MLHGLGRTCRVRKHQYLMHHVTEEVAPLIHVTHVHKHGLINF